MTGARPGERTWLQRLVARALADDLVAFVAPDARLARALGLDLGAAGLPIAVTPRHASALVLVGEIPAGLAEAAGVVYAQMPRPRTIERVGGAPVAGLPEPDVAVAATQEALNAGVAALRRAVAAGAFSPATAPFDIAATRTRQEYVCPMHPEIVREEPGQCPICGMDLVPRVRAAATTVHDHAATMASHGHVAMTSEHSPELSEAPTGGGQVFACPMHPEIEQAEPGVCQICGMRLVPRPENGEATAADPMSPEHAGHAGHVGHAAAEAASGHEHVRGHGREMVQTAAPAHDMDHAGMDQMAMDDAAMNHAAMGHAGMDHDMGGFMSMVAVTRDLPRSRDGLPMDWLDVSFGPLFPGLPGGLALTFTLDGDTVADAAAPGGVMQRGLDATWAGPAATFPDRLARLDPLSPVAYRLLAWRALDDAAGVVVPLPTQQERIWAAEWERTRSHLGWLAEFAGLIGDRALAQRAAAFQLEFARTRGAEALARLAPKARALVDSVRRSRLLRLRLAGVGALAGAGRDGAGPVALAAGSAVDVRLDDPAYQALGFAPVIADSDDALGRLQVRAGEIAASLELLQALPSPAVVAAPAWPADVSGSGQAAVETPRGAARLHVEIDRGAVVAAHLETPTDRNIALVPAATLYEEVADALVAVASLDLSPWERDR